MQRLLLAGLCVAAMSAMSVPVDALDHRFEEMYHETIDWTVHQLMPANQEAVPKAAVYKIEYIPDL